MDQCSKHDTPSVLSTTLTNPPGHGLIADIKSQNNKVLTGERLGHHDRRNPTTSGGPPLEHQLPHATPTAPYRHIRSVGQRLRPER